MSRKNTCDVKSVLGVEPGFESRCSFVRVAFDIGNSRYTIL